jgi:hypothetical protein
MKAFLLKLMRSLHKRIASQHVVVLGDSHAQIFGHDLFRIRLPFVRFDVCSVGGATVSSLDNPNSKTGELETFRMKLETAPNGSRVIVMLGEVDTGFVIWYRAEKYGESVEAILKKAIDNYSAFISEISTHHKPIVISTPLPTITDNNDWGEVANARKEISVEQFERTRLTLKFNTVIKAWCLQRGIPYLDLHPERLSEDGLVMPTLLNDDQCDHHYDPKKNIRLIVPKLRSVFRGVSR